MANSFTRAEAAARTGDLALLGSIAADRDNLLLALATACAAQEPAPALRAALG